MLYIYIYIYIYCLLRYHPLLRCAKKDILRLIDFALAHLKIFWGTWSTRFFSRRGFLSLENKYNVSINLISIYAIVGISFRYDLKFGALSLENLQKNSKNLQKIEIHSKNSNSKNSYISVSKSFQKYYIDLNLVKFPIKLQKWMFFIRISLEKFFQFMCFYEAYNYVIELNIWQVHRMSRKDFWNCVIL